MTPLTFESFQNSIVLLVQWNQSCSNTIFVKKSPNQNHKCDRNTVPGRKNDLGCEPLKAGSGSCSESVIKGGNLRYFW